MATEFYKLQAALTGAFENNGYQRVLTPAFELAHIFERGLSATEASRLLRFVDPQNGEVLALRSDITPQIARLMAGPMADVDVPVRLCYFGRVFRMREHLEFQRRELAQAGVELIGPANAEADAELIRVCSDSLNAADVTNCRVSLGHVGILHSVLDGLEITAAQAQELRALLLKKDRAGVAGLAQKLAISDERSEALAALCGLYGHADEILPRAEKLFENIPEAASGLSRLKAILDALRGHPSFEQIIVDLGEMQGFGYYTGFVFHVYVTGIGHAVASGGRYDTLIAKYGRDIPAAGFAIDEEGLTEAQHREQ